VNRLLNSACYNHYNVGFQFTLDIPYDDFIKSPQANRFMQEIADLFNVPVDQVTLFIIKDAGGKTTVNGSVPVNNQSMAF
jgi:hypothetical protein